MLDVDKARNAARTGVERVVAQTLCAGAAADALTQQPIEGFTALTRDVPRDWADGILSARIVAGAATSVMHDWARQARGAGLYWRDLAEPLGIDPDEDSYSDLGAAAFELIANPPAMQFDEIRTSWRCASCDQYVTDKGPYNGHPVDCEHGHAKNCTRHQAEITEYEARKAYRLARSRQAFAAKGLIATGAPAATEWDALTDHEREMSVLEARNWLIAAHLVSHLGNNDGEGED